MMQAGKMEKTGIDLYATSAPLGDTAAMQQARGNDDVPF
jgi:hypothetical protein